MDIDLYVEVRGAEKVKKKELIAAHFSLHLFSFL
jgi:hypothetical protein